MGLIQQGDKLTALQVMQDAPVIPVIVLHDVKHAVALARALVAGGIRMLEVTLRTPQALACLEAIAREVPEAVAGAGTVRSAADVQASLNAGALERLGQLKAWRAEVAREHNLPAFVIFHDATLRAIAERAPQSLTDLEGISGMGTKKLQAYGAEVLRVCGTPA